MPKYVADPQDPLDDDRGDGPYEHTDTPEDREALDRWARAYDDLNGAPEGDDYR
jgi:hypothetical protein